LRYRPRGARAPINAYADVAICRRAIKAAARRLDYADSRRSRIGETHGRQSVVDLAGTLDDGRTAHGPESSERLEYRGICSRRSCAEGHGASRRVGCRTARAAPYGDCRSGRASVRFVPEKISLYLVPAFNIVDESAIRTLDPLRYVSEEKLAPG